MEKYNKIHWAKGLDITPEIFIDSDNYHIEERNLLGCFFASRLYGISPDRKFHIRKRIDIHTFTLFIDDLECLAITPNGCVINIQSGTPFNKKVNLKEATGEELYVILTVHPHAIVPVDEKGLYAEQKYDFVLNSMEETIGDGIPVLKIYYDNDNQCWEIDDSYIPPSIALNSVDTLMEQYHEIKNKLDSIIEKLPEDNLTCMQALLLQWEFDNYCLQGPPQELTLLLKKICWVLKLYIKSIKKTDKLHDTIRFIGEEYNHNDSAMLLHWGYKSLKEIDRIIDEKEIVPMENEIIV